MSDPSRTAARTVQHAKSAGRKPEGGKSQTGQDRLKRGIYATSVHRALAALEENPEELRRSLGMMIADLKPVGRTEHLLVEHLALLEMERQRILRAHWGLQQQARNDLELERRRNAREVDSLSNPACSEEELLEKGLLNLPDSAAKFSELRLDCEGLWEHIEKADFAENFDGLFAVIYGARPSSRGADIHRLYNKFTERHNAGNPYRPEDPSDSDRPSYLLLRRLVAEELRNAIEAWQDFSQRHIQITQSMLDALLIPDKGQYALMIRHLNSIDRQIESKLRLIVELQKRRMPAVAPIRSRQLAGKLKLQRKLEEQEAKEPAAFRFHNNHNHSHNHQTGTFKKRKI